MMDKLMEHIRYAVDAEQQEAEKNHGRTFASAHEGYGVLAEELQEATDEQKHIVDAMSEMLTAIRKDEKDNIEVICSLVEGTAMMAACEFVQVAAMARKMTATISQSEEA